MALTESTMLPLGTAAPAFALPDPLQGKSRSLNELRGEKATLIIFMCNHCPFVLHVIDQIQAVANDYQSKGVRVVAISSNDVDNFPDDSPEKMAEFAQQKNFGFPYLYDESQEVARAYDAACTPDFYLFDADLKLRYRGQMDNARPGNGQPNDGADLRNAIESLLSGSAVTEDQYPSAGCNIKWKAA